MNKREEREFVKIVGEENALILATLFPNVRLPGKKFKNRIFRKRYQKEIQKLFKRDPVSMRVTRLAKKLGVGRQTIYNWR